MIKMMGPTGDPTPIERRRKMYIQSKNKSLNYPFSPSATTTLYFLRVRTPGL
jgi:hypothetical protein